MTTQAWSMTIDHNDDAGFRAWGSEVAARLDAAGLVQTTDTGQINWTTVSRPGTNSDAGYEIWRFDDTLQGTAPIFIRINYGTGGVATRPRMSIVVGTGSNGAGTITGDALTGTLIVASPAGTTTSPANEQSRVVVTEGFMAAVIGLDVISTSFSRIAFAIARTTDEDGDLTADGALVFGHNISVGATAGTRSQFLRFASPAGAQALTTASLILIPHGETATEIDDDYQAYIAWAARPAIRPVPQLCAVMQSEIPDDVSFETTLLGVTPRTYLAIGRSAGTTWSAGTPNNFGLAILWE